MGNGYQRHIPRVMVPELERFLNEIGCPHDLNKGEWVMTLPNNFRIYFGSFTEPNSLEGPHLTGWAWIDEAGLASRLAWEVAQRRTNNRNCPILITTVPYIDQWLKTDLYDKAMQGDPDIDWITCKTTDNLDYSRASIERARSTMRPERFKVYYEGEFSRPVGQIYPRPDDESLFVEPFPIPDNWPCYMGLDFGINDPTAAVWGRLSPDGVLYLVAEYEYGDLTIDEHLAIWQEMGLDVVDQGWGDPRGAETLKRLQRLGVPIVAAPDKNDILYGIEHTYAWLVQGRIKALRGLDAFQHYRSSYVWASDRMDEDKLLDKPKDPQPARHMMDALRYLVVGLVANGQGLVLPELSARWRDVSEASVDPAKLAPILSA